MIAKLREEISSALRKQEEMQLLIQAMSAEEREKAAKLAQQEKAQKQTQLAIQEQRAQLETQKAEKKAELAKTTIRAMAFGAKEWQKYFGEVGAAPPLPADIDKILDSACPFFGGKRVEETHLLVLIPANVDGTPFTLNLLGELIRRPQGGGNRTAYRFYHNDVQKKLGDQSSSRPSYWVLMTRDVLPDSRGKTYEDQKALVVMHACNNGLPYELPLALEAATAILLHYVRTGERLYTGVPWTYTRCQEMVANNKYSVVVGFFSAGGLGVYYFCQVSGDSVGVSCLRKF